MEESRSLVGRPVFKTGRGHLVVSGGFDSHFLPPCFLRGRLATNRCNSTATSRALPRAFWTLKVFIVKT